MSEVCGCVDGHNIDCSTLLQYRFPPPPENRIFRYWDDAKRSFHAAFLQVAVFCVAVYCVFPHFDYLKMRAKGRLSRWFFVPEWKVLREDKDGHELGSIEQIYEPVEEHRRAALNALMGSADTRNRSQSLPLSDTPREGLAERGDTTQDGAGGAPTFPPDTDPETRAMLNKFAELIHKANMTKIAEASSEPRIPSPTQTQQAGPSRISESPFSQYSIHPDSPEPSDRNSSPVTADFKTSALLSPSSRPSRKTRPFKTSASSQGKTIWMTTASYEDISNPPEPDPEDEPGTLYIHRNLSGNTLQVWLLGNEKEWATVQFGIKTQHPTFSDRYLAVRLDGTPNWLTLASWYSAKKWVNSR